MSITPDDPGLARLRATRVRARRRPAPTSSGFAAKGDTFTYEKHGFEATAYLLTTDQLGTQLDPPAHWAPEYPGDRRAAGDLHDPAAGGDPDARTRWPRTSAMRCRSPTSRPGRRSTARSRRARWSSCAPTGRRAGRTRSSPPQPFPGVGLDALKFLHEERHILFHGHEPLDTDATPTLEGEYWLMHNGYAQAEGVANLDQVPRDRLPRRHRLRRSSRAGSAATPATWRSARRTGRTGSTISAADAPLPKSDKPLHWDAAAGMRVR